MPRSNRKQRRQGVFNALDVSRGECTILPEFSIPDGYAAEIVNFKLVRVGEGRSGKSVVPVTRPGLSRVTSEPLPNGEAILSTSHSATKLCLASEDNIYYLDEDNNPVLIGKCEAKLNECLVELLNCNGYLIVLDGSYPKYWDETNYNLIYDASGYEFDYRFEADDGAINLYSGSITRAGQSRTTPDWMTGFTLPTGPVVAALSKTGSPTGNVYLRVYDNNDLLVVESNPIDVSELTTEAIDYTFTFASAYMRSGDTSYTYSVEYDGGDSSNYIKAHYTNTATSGGLRTYQSLWTTDSLKNLLIGVRPSLPPKARWGLVWNERLFLAGNTDNSSPNFEGSKIYYSALPDEESPGDSGPFNWGSGSLSGGDAGYIGVDRGDGAAITGICSGFAGLIITKGPSPSGVYLLSGTTPLNWSLTKIVSGVYSVSGYAMLETANNVFFTDGTGAGLIDLHGITAYGDINYRPLSWPIDFKGGNLKDRSVAYGADDQIWYLAASDGTMHVYHPRFKAWVRYEFGKGDQTWDEIDFSWDDWLWNWGKGFSITPAAVSSEGKDLFVCGDNGHLYLVDQDYQKDDILLNKPVLWSKVWDLGSQSNLKQAKRLDFQITTRGVTGAAGTLSFKKDLESSACLTKSFRLPLSSEATWGDYTLHYQEMIWLWNGEPTQNRGRTKINFNFRHLQIGLTDLGTLTAPLQINGAFINYALLGEH